MSRSKTRRRRHAFKPSSRASSAPAPKHTTQSLEAQAAKRKEVEAVVREMWKRKMMREAESVERLLPRGFVSPWPDDFPFSWMVLNENGEVVERHATWGEYVEMCRVNPEIIQDTIAERERCLEELRARKVEYDAANE